VDWSLGDYGFDEATLREKILYSFEERNLETNEDALELKYGRKGVVEVVYVNDPLDVRFEINFEPESDKLYEGNQIDLWALTITHPAYRRRGLEARTDEAIQSLAKELGLGRVLVSGIDLDEETFWFRERGYKPVEKGTMGIKVL